MWSVGGGGGPRFPPAIQQAGPANLLVQGDDGNNNGGGGGIRQTRTYRQFQQRQQMDQRLSQNVQIYNAAMRLQTVTHKLVLDNSITKELKREHQKAKEDFVRLLVREGATSYTFMDTTTIALSDDNKFKTINPKEEQIIAALIELGVLQFCSQEIKMEMLPFLVQEAKEEIRKQVPKQPEWKHKQPSVDMCQEWKIREEQEQQQLQQQQQQPFQ